MKLLPDSDMLAPWTFLHPNDAALFIYFYFFIFLLSYPAEHCVFSSAGSSRECLLLYGFMQILQLWAVTVTYAFAF